MWHSALMSPRLMSGTCTQGCRHTPPRRARRSTCTEASARSGGMRTYSKQGTYRLLGVNPSRPQQGGAESRCRVFERRRRAELDARVLKDVSH